MGRTKILLIDWNMMRSKNLIWTIEDEPIELGQRVQLWSGDEDDAMTCEGNVIVCRPAPFAPDRSYLEIALDPESWCF